ncbi:DEKNAAC103134 [Brettanomyces naardenensis]|uniref:DEKNAAC103134 n=1 Tax=Brettanomyces naardenensis TaxID=13370 RepID=A0A448YMF8_BRENA|nr:DEKNAAC103134 [Brettanomyces naardenensis]
MSVLITVLFYSFAMAVSSFLAGILPLLFNVPPEKMDYMSTFSMGVLVSAAQVLIIPEGVANSPQGSPIGLWLLAGFITLFTIDRLSSIFKDEGGYLPSSSQSFDIDDDTAASSLGDTSSILNSTSLSQILFREKWEDLQAELKNGLLSAFQNTDTLGLLIHCLTDGIALTSSIMGSTESESIQSIFIVMAIFLHKLPTGFALAALLLKDGLPRIYILCHLFAFSIAAPLGAIATYLVIVLFVDQNLEGLSWLLLTFSGGSFLYVGFHALMKMGHTGTRKEQMTQYGFCLLGMLVTVAVSELSGS